MKALGYIRVSTDEATQASFPSQISIIKEAAKAKGLTLADEDIYRDEASRSIWPRPGAQRMLDALTNEVRAVFIWQASRLYGDQLQQFAIAQLFAVKNVKLFDGHGTHLNAPGAISEFTAALQASLNKFEVDQGRERTREVLTAKAKAGDVLQRAPFGLRTVNGTFAVDEATIGYVRQMFRWAADGESAWSIARRLDALGVPRPSANYNYNGPRSNNWNNVGVRRVLSNQIYKGQLVWNQTKTVRVNGTKKQVAQPESEWIVRPSPAGVVVDLELWEAANSSARRRAVKWVGRSGSDRPRHVLEGRLQCSRCGKRMYYRARGQGDYVVYACARPCQRSIGRPVIERRLTEVLERWGQPDEVVGRERIEPTPEEDPNAEEMAQLDAALTKIAHKKARTLHLYQEELIDFDEFTEARGKITTQWETTSRRQDYLRSLQAPQPETPSSSVKEGLASLLERIFDTDLPVEQRQEELGRVVDSVWVFRDGKGRDAPVTLTVQFAA